MLCAGRVAWRDVDAEGSERRDLDPDGQRVANQYVEPAGQTAPAHDKDQTMGYSTPKTPFDLTAFLNQEGRPQFARKPAWNRRPTVTPKAPDAPVEPTGRRAPDPV